MSFSRGGHRGFLLRSHAAVGIVLAAAALACGPQDDATVSADGQESLSDTQDLDPVVGSHFGDPLPGLTTYELARFNAGKEEFQAIEQVSEGLGPVYNGNSCTACHSDPSVGGSRLSIVTRFGRVTNGVFDPLANLGGSLVNQFGIGRVTVAGRTCDIAGEVVPAAANVVAPRQTPPLYGLGLVDAVPDATFIALAQREAYESPQTAGRINMVNNISAGHPTVGKFGQKDMVPSLFQFSGDAYVNEMGITNPQFPNESCPQGDCSLVTGPTSCDPVADPEDDGTDVAKFADFMTFLAPPPPGVATADAESGLSLFSQIGCTNCHTPTLTTGPNPVAALDHKRFAPYSDFLLHDMGSLGDGIALGDSGLREMRTAPLWGLRARARLLHDGRATTVSEAIEEHDGQGRFARDRYMRLSNSQRAALASFLNKL